MTLSVVKENIIKGGMRILKVLEYGAKTADVISDFGDDSSPLKDMIAVYSATAEDGDSVIVGYINKHQISQPGEKRIFSLNKKGEISFAIHLRNDGTCEVGGSADNLVRYMPLQDGLQAQVSLLNQELAKISSSIGAVGGSYIPGQIELNIDNSKIDELKTI